MKNNLKLPRFFFISTLAHLLISTLVFAQSPEKMSYQAVIRNSSNALVTNTYIAMRISILQGSASGTAVYIETINPLTNANGLVSIEIGGGSVVSGTFATINWANGSYFIKTETDPDGATGGTTYSIIGTSQLLSVPYALYAKTAGSISGHYVGEFYGGGVVFWVDHTGQHGLIASVVDISGGHVWSDFSSDSIGANNDWDGASNTTAIIGKNGHTSSAAKLCADYINDAYGTGTYDDWYLPSIAELNHVWNNFYEIQKALATDGNDLTTLLARKGYWSSSDLIGSGAWYFDFIYGYTYDSSESNTLHVRAVRAF